MHEVKNSHTTGQLEAEPLARSFSGDRGASFLLLIFFLKSMIPQGIVLMTIREKQFKLHVKLYGIQSSLRSHRIDSRTHAPNPTILKSLDPQVSCIKLSGICI